MARSQHPLRSTSVGTPSPGNSLPVTKPETGPFLYTFTARLPFVLGVADTVGHEVALPNDFCRVEDRATFGKPPHVAIRIFNAELADRKFCPANFPNAIRRFYEAEYPFGESDGIHLYEQWITLETPATFLEGERQTDAAYAFHRCLWTLNLFLQAFALARDDDQVRPVSARELRPIVVIGRLGLDGHWTVQGPMLMHPDAKARPLSSRPVAEHLEGLKEAMASIVGGKPFVRAKQWQARAERRKYEGDAADAVISFQTAAEVLGYELWALLLIDEGTSETEVRQHLEHGVPFKSLLTRELSSRLGGSWDLTSTTAPVGRYWSQLYALRNRIVHAGYLPHDGDAETAETAFVDFDRFLDAQLAAKSTQFPNTAFAKLKG